MVNMIKSDELMASVTVHTDFLCLQSSQQCIYWLHIDALTRNTNRMYHSSIWEHTCVDKRFKMQSHFNECSIHNGFVYEKRSNRWSNTLQVSATMCDHWCERYENINTKELRCIHTGIHITRYMYSPLRMVNLDKWIRIRWNRKLNHLLRMMGEWSGNACTNSMHTQQNVSSETNWETVTKYPNWLRPSCPHMCAICPCRCGWMVSEKCTQTPALGRVKCGGRQFLSIDDDDDDQILNFNNFIIRPIPLHTNSLLPYTANH